MNELTREYVNNQQKNKGVYQQSLMKAQEKYDELNRDSQAEIEQLDTTIKTQEKDAQEKYDKLNRELQTKIEDLSKDS